MPGNGDGKRLGNAGAGEICFLNSMVIRLKSSSALKEYSKCRPNCERISILM